MQTTPMKPDLEDIVSATQELASDRVKPILDALECVESVETIDDARANLLEALTEAKALVAELEAITKRLGGAR